MASYNANNQQLTFGTNTETYDFNGNLAMVTDADGTATYTWNVRNQLASITATGFAASLTYDSFGRRTGKTVQGATSNFVYDGIGLDNFSDGWATSSYGSTSTVEIQSESGLLFLCPLTILQKLK